jgi:two-component system, chemotaxis family, sensor kinase Cph1
MRLYEKPLAQQSARPVFGLDPEAVAAAVETGADGSSARWLTIRVRSRVVSRFLPRATGEQTAPQIVVMLPIESPSGIRAGSPRIRVASIIPNGFAITIRHADFFRRERIEIPRFSMREATAPDNESIRLRHRVTELEARVRDLQAQLDTVPVLISYVGPDERYRRANLAYEEIFGVTPASIVGLTIEQVTGQPHYAIAAPYVSRAMAGERVRFESQIRHKDGTLHTIEVLYTPHVIDSVVQGIVICVRDIDDERRAQAAVRVRERDLLSVLNSVPDVISRYSRDRRFVFTSAAVLRHTGFPPEHFTSKTHAELGFPDHICRLFDESLDRIFESGHNENIQFEFIGPNGLRQYEALGTPEFGDDGAAVSVLTVTHDVTDRVRAEEELRRSEERQRLAVEAGRVGLWHWDINANRVEWSDLIYDIHGIAPGEFPGTVEAFASLVHSEDREAVSEALSAALSGRSDYHAEFRTVRPDGAIRWIYTNGRVVFENGQPARMFGSMLDLTESKAAAEALALANRELRRANEDLNQFAYSASHDLREPLRMISLYSQLLKRKYGSQLDEQANQYINYAASGAQRLGSLLRDLLEYGNAIGAGSAASSEQVDMDEALQSAISNLQVAMQESGAVVTRGDLPVISWRNSHAIQVFQNLVGNAVKYRHPERPPHIEIAAERHANSWHFSVSDNGIGVDTRYHERIFGIFKRLHAAHEYEGTGIGLAICQKVVERNGGRIWLESEPDRGSTFYFTVPAR